VLIEYGAKIPPYILFHFCHWDLADWKIGYPEQELLYAEVVRILIDAGVDPNLTMNGRTAADGIAGDELYAIEAELKRHK
jgi:hypothetical protein